MDLWKDHPFMVSACDELKPMVMSVYGINNLKKIRQMLYSSTSPGNIIDATQKEDLDKKLEELQGKMKRYLQVCLSPIQGKLNTAITGSFKVVEAQPVESVNDFNAEVGNFLSTVAEDDVKMPIIIVLFRGEEDANGQRWLHFLDGTKKLSSEIFDHYRSVYSSLPELRMVFICFPDGHDGEFKVQSSATPPRVISSYIAELRQDILKDGTNKRIVKKIN